MQIIDADGHINDLACGEDIANYMPKGNQMAALFPELDHLHFRYLKQKRRGTGNPTPDDWMKFLDKTGISWTVLYPTAGLAVGRIVAEEWAILACRAYNNWLYERFLNKNTRLKGMALIPLQNVAAAVGELRRAVKDLGMLGGMLPSNGEAIQGHLGNKIYWPLYEEAEKLGCPLAVHVGCLHHMGFDSFGTYYPAHALGHPFSLMIQAAGMLAHGVFEEIRHLESKDCHRRYDDQPVRRRPSLLGYIDLPRQQDKHRSPSTRNNTPDMPMNAPSQSAAPVAPGAPVRQSVTSAPIPNRPSVVRSTPAPESRD